jgi:hypothetical protein
LAHATPATDKPSHSLSTAVHSPERDYSLVCTYYALIVPDKVTF